MLVMGFQQPNPGPTERRGLVPQKNCFSFTSRPQRLQMTHWESLEELIAMLKTEKKNHQIETTANTNPFHKTWQDMIM